MTEKLINDNRYIQTMTEHDENEKLISKEKY